MRKYFLVFGIVYVLILVTGGSTVHALTTGPSIITLPNPLNTNTIAGLITQITSALAIIAVPIVGVAIIFGAHTRSSSQAATPKNSKPAPAPYGTQ